jgi:hypothetical protein
MSWLVLGDKIFVVYSAFPELWTGQIADGRLRPFARCCHDVMFCSGVTSFLTLVAVWLLTENIGSAQLV